MRYVWMYTGFFFCFFFIIMEVQGERSSPPGSYWAALITIEGDVLRNLQRSRGGGDQDEHYKLLGEGDAKSRFVLGRILFYISHGNAF